MSQRQPATAGRWIGLVLGLPIVAYGVHGAVEHLPGVQLTSFARFFLGGPLVHDLLLAPVAGLVAWLVGWVLPSFAVGPVRAGLAATVVVGLVAWPLVGGYGATAGEPSFLARDYAASVVVASLLIWLVVAVQIVRFRRR